MPEIPDPKGHGPEVPTPDPNPPIVTWVKKDGVLEKQTTHADPKVHRESFSIENAQAQIDKINAAIAMWEAKKAPYQAIIDKYAELGK